MKFFGIAVVCKGYFTYPRADADHARRGYTVYGKAVGRLVAVLLFVLAPTLLDSQAGPPKTYEQAFKAWIQAHPYPTNGSAEDRQKYDQELAQATGEWIKRWPEDVGPWQQRLRALVRLASTPNQELEEIGDTVLKLAREHPFKGFRLIPIETEVAEAWDMRNIRLEQCLELTRQAALEDERFQADNPSLTRQLSLNVGLGFFRTLSIESDAAQKLKKFDIARSAIARMKQWLDENPGDHRNLERQYLQTAGFEAEQEGHKPDALLYYSRELSESAGNTSATSRAPALWTELGGTESGFQAWMAVISGQPQMATKASDANSRWTPMNRPLTDFHGNDLKGRMWTVDDLKGKTTIVSVWATWCRPCHEELPAVQKLFDDLSERKGVQVVTVSTDEKLSALNRFMLQRQYTFPVVQMSSETVDKMAGMEGIPRTWIVDANGCVRFEMVGYDPGDWPDRVMQQLVAVK